jgi:hypothetical protein
MTAGMKGSHGKSDVIQSIRAMATASTMTVAMTKRHVGASFCRTAHDSTRSVAAVVVLRNLSPGVEPTPGQMPSPCSPG